MGWAQKSLAVLLRLAGVVMLVAVVPAVMPWEWMAAIHHWLGLGRLPDEPIVGYMARSLSAGYAVLGALVLYVSFDVRRYLPVIKLLGAVGVAFGVGMILLDCVVGLPLWWILGEGPLTIAFGAALLWLAARVGREASRMGEAGRRQA